VLISSESQSAHGQLSATIKRQGPLSGPLAFVSDLARESQPRPGRTSGSERTAGLNCFMPAAERTARACKRERGLQGRFPPAPPLQRARVVSGAFSFGVPPGTAGRCCGWFLPKALKSATFRPSPVSGLPLRPTRDIDLLGFGLAEIPLVVAAFEGVCGIEVDDGMAWGLPLSPPPADAFAS
jgi:hypothetical protein